MLTHDAHRLVPPGVPSMSKISRSLQEIVGGKSQSQSLNTTRPRPSSSVPGPSGWSMMVAKFEKHFGAWGCVNVNTRFMNSWFVQLRDTCLGADYPPYLGVFYQAWVIFFPGEIHKLRKCKWISGRSLREMTVSGFLVKYN